MLKVIIGAFTKEQKKKMIEETKSILITDVELYHVLNGEDETINASFDDYEKIADSIYEKSKTENIILHTFNPLFHNYFSDEVAIESFLFFDEKTNSFKKVFENEQLKKKLSALAPGDAISDVYFKEVVLCK